MATPASETIRVSVPGTVKAKLETQAAKEGISLNDYVRRNFNQLVLTGEAVIDDRQGSITVPNIWWPYEPPTDFVHSSRTTPFYRYPASAPAHKDPIDAMIDDMRKIFVAKMLTGMLNPTGNSSPEDYQRILNLLEGKSKKDEFSFNDMMKWQMFNSQIEREASRLQQQYEMHKSRGDESGAGKTMDAISTLIAAQQSQNSQFMQQFGLMSQANQQAQTNLFSTAIGAQRDVDSTHRQERSEFQNRLDLARQDFWQGQMNMMNKMNEQQMNWMNQELQRVRDTKSKDTLQQLAEIVEMREKSPIMKAAFNAAFGVEQESLIGKLIPQLKEMGIDQVIKSITDAATRIITQPRVPKPTPPTATPSPTPRPSVPQPSQPTSQPTSQPSPDTLENLTLPGEESPPQPAKQQPPQPQLKTEVELQKELPEEAVGYTNLEAQGQAKKPPK